MKSVLAVFFIATTLCIGITVYTEPKSILDLSELEEKKRILLSLSARDYPVTPGDVYIIAYVSADSEVSYETVVESDNIVNLGIFGEIDAKNLTFPEFSRLVKQRVLRAYPDSMPSIRILSNGQFNVFVKGEVKEATYIIAWGLTRLSNLSDGLITDYSSLRDVEIISEEGKSKYYDLFRAKRFGESQHDPYLKPGDTVLFHEKTREIQLEGAVKREGTYQLLDNEGLFELIDVFGGGFTAIADPSRIRLERILTEEDKIAESFNIDLSRGYENSTQLMDYDRIVVPETIDYLPVVFIEGAIHHDIENTNNNKLDNTELLAVPIKEGDTLYYLLRERMEFIKPTADLENAYLYRPSDGDVVQVDLQALLYDYKLNDDIVLEPYDRVIIPFRQLLVLVTGAVYDPGQYPYVPNQKYSYYVDMAGGVNPELGTTKAIQVTDKFGERISKESHIEPETRVYVPYSFSYYFLKYFPVIVSSAVVIFNLVQVLEIFEIVP